MESWKTLCTWEIQNAPKCSFLRAHFKMKWTKNNRWHRENSFPSDNVRLSDMEIPVVHGAEEPPRSNITPRGDHEGRWMQMMQFVELVSFCLGEKPWTLGEQQNSTCLWISIHKKILYIVGAPLMPFLTWLFVQNCLAGKAQHCTSSPKIWRSRSRQYSALESGLKWTYCQTTCISLANIRPLILYGCILMLAEMWQTDVQAEDLEEI